MTFWDEIGQAIQHFIAEATLPPADTTRLAQAISDLEDLIPIQRKEPLTMSAPTGMVQIAQADLNAFATAFENVKSVLASYIATLIAGQATPLPAADEAILQKALSDLSSLEPPAPPPTP